jgi:hypothetical protein
MSTPRFPSSAVRLVLARSHAWALLFAGWLVLGALGRQHLPLWFGGQLPVALWLGAVGALLALAAGRKVPISVLRLALVCAGAITAAALAWVARGGGAGALLLAAPAWGALLVGTSFQVRALRQTSATRPPAPLVPALIGAALAWCVAGDLAAMRISADGVALAVGAATLVVAALAPPATRGASACRSGLFDCSWPLPTLQAWRRAADWPLQAAMLVMLPMMAALPLMAEWCGTGFDNRFAGQTSIALHLAAMLLPAWALHGPLQHLGRHALRHAVTAALVAGAVMLAVWPGVAGLMSASLLQASAWSLAWAGPMLSRPTPANGVLPAASSAPLSRVGLVATSMVTCGAVLALGSAIAAHGPAALIAVHAALAAIAAFGWSCSRVRRRLPGAKVTQAQP